MSSIKCFFLLSLLGSFVYWVRKTFNHQLIVIVMRQSSHLLQNHKRVLFCPVISQQQETTALHGTGFLSTACAHKSSFVLEIPSAKNMNIKDEKRYLLVRIITVQSGGFITNAEICLDISFNLIK